MLTIRKVFTILCLLCLCWGIGNTVPWVAFKANQLTQFFQMSVRAYSVPG